VSRSQPVFVVTDPGPKQSRRLGAGLQFPRTPAVRHCLCRESLSRHKPTRRRLRELTAAAPQEEAAMRDQPKQGGTQRVRAELVPHEPPNVIVEGEEILEHAHEIAERNKERTGAALGGNNAHQPE
jgi:hypothetical protein